MKEEEMKAEEKLAHQRLSVLAGSGSRQRFGGLQTTWDLPHTVVLTPVGGRTRVSDVNADEGSPHNAGSNTTLPARVQTRSRPPCPVLSEQERYPDSQGAWSLCQLSEEMD